MSWRRSDWDRGWREGEEQFSKGHFHTVFWGRDTLYMNKKYLLKYPRLRAFVRKFPELLYVASLLGFGHKPTEGE